MRGGIPRYPLFWGTLAVAEQDFIPNADRLNRWLMSLGGRSPCPNGIGQLLRDYEISRRRLRSAASRCLARPYAEALLRFHSEGCVALPPTAHARSGTQAFSAVPLALVGGPFTPQYWSLLDEIEKAGGSIVLNATDAGERSLGADPPAAQPDPASIPDVESLSRLFLNRVVDVFQRPNDRFYQWIAGRLAERRVRGIILWHFLACDLWRAERRTLEDRFRLPVLMLEADDTKGGGPRNKTRVQAFLESLTHRPTS